MLTHQSHDKTLFRCCGDGDEGRSVRRGDSHAGGNPKADKLLLLVYSRDTVPDFEHSHIDTQRSRKILPSKPPETVQNKIQLM